MDYTKYSEEDLQANLARVDKMLATIPETSVIERLGFDHIRQEILEALAAHALRRLVELVK